MKVPLSWLREYVDLPPSVAQLAERLTLAGLEVASVRTIGLPPPEGLRVKQEDAGPVWQPDKVLIGFPGLSPHYQIVLQREGALDAMTKAALQDELLRVHARTGASFEIRASPTGARWSSPTVASAK